MKYFVIGCLVCSMLFGQILYEEHFTGGAMQLDWHPWFYDSLGIGDSMLVISDPTAPGGDGWAGRISNEYMSVAGLTYAGDAGLTDYSIEAWIYTVVTAAMGPYNGIAMRMDQGSGYYYRLVSDFDDSGRLRLGLVASGGYPVVLRDWTGAEIPGGVPVSSSWHKLKMTIIADSIWCYYDDALLVDCPIIDDSVAQGYFGVYTFNMLDTASTKCDDIVVTGPTGISEYGSRTVSTLSVFPNPFRRFTDIRYPMSNEWSRVKIYDASGRLIKDLQPSLASGNQLSVTWDGRDAAGNALAPGVYFIGDIQSRQMAKDVKID
jgi:hypothetical protein